MKTETAHVPDRPRPMSKPRFQLLIEATPAPDDPQAVRQLRHLLKRLGRSFGFKAVAVTPIETGETPNVGEKIDQLLQRNARLKRTAEIPTPMFTSANARRATAIAAAERQKPATNGNS